MTTLVLGGCGSTRSGGAVDKALDWVGLQRPDPAAMPKAPEVASPALAAARPITLRLHAGSVLNTALDGRSLSVVARAYLLRDHKAFERATYESLLPAGLAGARPDWAQDVVGEQEVVLTPGQRLEWTQKVPTEAKYIAVVALFRAPDAQRWRFIFDSAGAARTGLTLGVHACALSVATGEPLGAGADAARLAGVRCP